jgi:hypothetical protein
MRVDEAAGADPIFVRGMSRSGGTLVVTILDAHSSIAMSYELYPELLELDDPSPRALEGVAEHLRSAKDLVTGARALEPKNFRTFVLRCQRSGLTNHDVADLLSAQARAGGLGRPDARLDFVERCGGAKLRRVGKRRWGAKCTQDYESYLAKWPDACFLNLVRDGRDVLASQQNTGAFRNTPEQVARGWARTHKRFQELLRSPGVRAYEIRYERLVADPANEVRSLTAFLGLRFEEDMLDYHRAELTIFGASHLSMDRISMPVDASKVGRWRRDLSEEDLHRFEETAGEIMELLGYELSR